MEIRNLFIFSHFLVLLLGAGFAIETKLTLKTRVEFGPIAGEGDWAPYANPAGI